MGRFIFDLSDERRERLEDYRAANGLRSLAAAVQHLIDNAGPVLKIYSGTSPAGQKPTAQGVELKCLTAEGGGDVGPLVGYSLVRPKPGSLLKKR